MGLATYVKNDLPNWPNWINFLFLKLNCFGGLVYGKSYYQIRKHLDDSDPEQLLLKIVNHAIQNVPYYRNKYGQLNIKSIDDFKEKIGFIDKNEVMAHWEDFLVDNIDWKKVSVGTTGGTSGKPLKLVSPNDRYSWELAFMHKQWNKVGWHYHIRGVLRNHNLNGRNYEINPVLREIIFDPNKLNDDYVIIIYKTLKKYNVKYITAYPSNAYQFCKLCAKHNLSLSFIKAFLCGSEGITPEQKVYFDQMNIRILSWYGHSEKLILGSTENSLDRFRIEPNYGFCEVIDDNGNNVVKNGDKGELVGTTFFNYYFPLIRYRTGDYTTFQSYNHGIVLSKILGRWDKSLIYKIDGTTTSLTILNLHGSFYEHIDGLQFIQEKIGYLKAIIIKGKDFTLEDETFFIHYLANAMGGGQYVSIEYVDRLIFLPNGKFLPLISSLN